MIAQHEPMRKCMLKFRKNSILVIAGKNHDQGKNYDKKCERLLTVPVIKELARSNNGRIKKCSDF